ncbi:MAG: HAD-IA family hydrolase [Pseudomonadota bacterium]
MIIAWDFDGVLNRNQDAGRYVWEADFEREVGQSASAFGAFVFGQSPHVITGEIDILDRLEEWTSTVECRMDARAILDYWLEQDARPDTEMLSLVDDLKQAGARQIIATNNEALRAAYISGQMGMAARMERVFASGPMGVAKPDARYFRHIEESLDAAPESFFFIDDRSDNVDAAIDAGWQAYHFTPGTRAALIERLQPGGTP